MVGSLIDLIRRWIIKRSTEKSRLHTEPVLLEENTVPTGPKVVAIIDVDLLSYYRRDSVEFQPVCIIKTGN